MLPEIHSALTGLNAARQLITAVISTSNEVKKNEVVIQFQNAVLDLQGKLYDIQSKFDELKVAKETAEKSLAEHTAWENQARRYELAEIKEGMFVYVLKEAEANGEPTHWVCPNCFQKKQ